MIQTKEYVDSISKEDLYWKLKRGEAIQLVNVLYPDFHYLGVIQGSAKIPFDEIEYRAHELDRAKEIITYSAHEDCFSSSIAAEKLIRMGFNAKTYEGGIKEWKEAGLPTE